MLSLKIMDNIYITYISGREETSQSIRTTVQACLHSTTFFTFNQMYDFSKTAFTKAFTAERCVLERSMDSGKCQIFGKHLIFRKLENEVCLLPRKVIVKTNYIGCTVVMHELCCYA